MRRLSKVDFEEVSKNNFEGRNAEREKDLRPLKVNDARNRLSMKRDFEEKARKSVRRNFDEREVYRPGRSRYSNEIKYRNEDLRPEKQKVFYPGAQRFGDMRPLLNKRKNTR